jgi:hypothetical protein
MSAAVPPALHPVAPPCPKCKVPLIGITGQGEGLCDSCATPLEFVLFPAMHRPRTVARVVRSVDGDATCFFHAQNQAAAVCDGCGRYVCAVCEVTGDEGRKLCPPCVSAGRKKTVVKADQLVAYDAIAMSLAILPILVWPVTLVTAPMAMVAAIYGWRKPRSLVRPGCARLVWAILIAALHMSAWLALGIALWLKK